MKHEINLPAYNGEQYRGPGDKVKVEGMPMGTDKPAVLDIILGDDSADPGEMPGLLIENRDGEWFVGVSRNNGGDLDALIHIPKDENKDIWAERGHGDDKFTFVKDVR